MDQTAEWYATIAAALAGQATIEDAVAALIAIPPGGPHRGALAAALIERLITDNGLPALMPMHRQLDDLLRIGAADPAPARSWPAIRAMGRAMQLTLAGARFELRDPDAALEEVEALAADTDGDPRARAIVESAVLALSVVQGVAARGDPLQTEAWDRMRRFVRSNGGSTAGLDKVYDVLQEVMTGRSDDFGGAAERLRHAADGIPEEARRLAGFDDVVRQFDRMAIDGPSGYRTAAGAADEAVLLGGSVLPLLAPDADGDQIEEGVRRTREAVALSDPGYPTHAFHLFGLAFALVRRSERTNSVADLPEAEELLTEVISLLRGPQDRLWEMAHGLLADVRLRLGHGGDVHRDAIESLRTHVWQVFMQPDAAGASAVAREAAESAVDVAYRCLRVNDVAGAVRALDAGRGLALYAATEQRSVPDRLRAAGHPELAGRWQQVSAESGPPSTLRRKVISALVEIAPGGALFDPPTTAQIRAALTELDLDALVYLVPAGERGTGLAVVVPATGRLGYLGLPGLNPGESPEVAAYLAGARRRDTAIVGRTATRDLGSLDQDFTEQLHVVRDWAWRAAMGPVVEQFVSSLPSRDRVPRLALVPMGELALIPWQAAGRAGGEPLIRTVALSQTASARMLCRSADLRPLPASRLGMIVGDPDTAGAASDLAGARVEAYEIRQAFYRGGRYLGRLPDDHGTRAPSGAGTAGQVRAWLTSASRAAGSMLHLACHGIVSSGRSYLLLADGTPLSAEELVRLMDAVPDRALSLVVLAACSTGLAAGDYDEAYSLGTAFLAAGVRSVLSTQWTIPDASTSLLMFMFHHYLITDGLPVWAALHRAQLWMIDPGRVAPDTMPEPLRRQLADGRTDPADVAGWAGFLHGGR
ncbi:hypothetical protein J2S43_001650 [Catenuloplanes nepalensis]|uniref:CHAT domain-containing protein n=1 Tax=Catenuloplanes nepalensis TaxID=587533 RepID=A0ABT9MP15_9ACTN|nr:CHAT domain-containing protein [Catenuloplanes nepalensis]MDP9793138.1 hypothetical protein [Catenuloplanes nepalensis]